MSKACEFWTKIPGFVNFFHRTLHLSKEKSIWSLWTVLGRCLVFKNDKYRKVSVTRKLLPEEEFYMSGLEQIRWRITRVLTLLVPTTFRQTVTVILRSLQSENWFRLRVVLLQSRSMSCLRSYLSEWGCVIKNEPLDLNHMMLRCFVYIWKKKSST